jgi:hypothetical protein
VRAADERRTDCDHDQSKKGQNQTTLHERQTTGNRWSVPQK